MTTALREPHTSERCVSEASTTRTPGPHIELDRHDISFRNVARDRVSIQVVLWHRGGSMSQPTTAVLQAALFGAFVPWQPLTTVLVPALGPGQAFRFRVEAGREAPTPVGEPERVSPPQFLTALVSTGRTREASISSAWGRLGRLFSRRRRRQQARAETEATGRLALPTDLFDLMGRSNPYWAGNLNVFVGGKPVERHLAQALRIYPGRVNLAMFIVGSGRDAYSFCLYREDARWDATLFDITGGESLVLDLRNREPVPCRQWIEVNSMRLMMLAVRPPETCRQGKVQVHVDQRSTGQTAIVEFSLDPAAAGPGCYVV